MSAADQTLPKAELHVHLEGTITPRRAREIAQRNGKTVPPALMDEDDTYGWSSASEFFEAYDAAASCLATAGDYAEVASSYLSALAGEGGIYAELTVSPSHAASVGVGWEDHLDGVADGVHRAKAATGIEARLIVTGLRHEPPEQALEIARRLYEEPHPLVTGFGLAGDEQANPLGGFTAAFEMARSAGLGCTVHAGEILGAQSVREALDLPITRVGHGVRAIEDGAVVEALVRQSIVLEVCPSSNLALGIFPSWEDHPLRRLHAAGVAVTLNTDDPPHFATTLGAEYALARRVFGFSDDDLCAMTRTALSAAFVDDRTRARLLAQL